MYEKAPTYEEVQAFAQSEGLDSRTNVAKFYDYYSKTNFLFKGTPMDWKGKLREWAQSEKPRTRSYVTAAEHNARKHELPFKNRDEMLAYYDKADKLLGG